MYLGGKMLSVLQAEDYSDMSAKAARHVARIIRKKPAAVLTLPTGDTPKGLYEHLVALHQKGHLDFSRIAAFNLDELLGTDNQDPVSYAMYLYERLLSRVNVRPENIHLISSSPEDEHAECERYESLIKEVGGIDLAILGIGENGHIGFNEPGTPWESITHVTTITKATLKKMDKDFTKKLSCPVRAITMGIRTIMNSKAILLLASGPEKADILAKALLDSPALAIPASVLQRHPHVTIIADKDAAEWSRSASSPWEKGTHRAS